jgi:myosin heavy subunit
MYVVSTINTGITVIQERHKSQSERKRLETTVAKYERKIDTELNADQKKEYDHLTAGLVKLKEDAKAAREYQEKMAQLAIEKEKELDVYQETINAMMVDKLKTNQSIKEKDQIITKVSADSAKAIASLKEDLEVKTNVLEEKTAEIQKRTIEVKNIEKRVAELSTKEILAANQAVELKELTKVLNRKEQELESAKTFQTSLQNEKDSIVQNSQAQLQKIQKERDSQARAAHAEYARLNDEKASIKAQSQANLEQYKKEKDVELADLKTKYLKATEGLRKEIAVSLAGKLSDSGLSASVNPSTGDVTVHFKNAYYDYNSSILKDAMKEELKVFIPLYAKSLFENKKYASSISSVEIIGSASPSFKGKYVNPRSMASADEKQAMNYNMDLSYRRAKGIFEYTFLTNDMAFQHKDEILHLIKVSGTGYLQAMDELVSLPESAQDQKKGFCGTYNCEVFQKVTLRFNLKDKVAHK